MFDKLNATFQSSNLAEYIFSDSLSYHEYAKNATPACCELLYAYYRETHAPVSSLTVDADMFCATLPETVMCRIEDGKPIHCAFIEPDESDCEIAYVGTADLSSFCGFAESLVHALFQEYATLTAECDDTDSAAMILKSMFRTSSDDSYDTYILE